MTSPGRRAPGTVRGSTSSDLVEGVRRREPEAWRRLAYLYGPLVYRWCRRAGLAEDDAEEVLQKVFLTVVERIGEFRPGSAGVTFREWLRAATRHHLVDWFQREAPRQPAADGTPARHLPAEGPVPPPPDAEDERALYHRALALIQPDVPESDWQTSWRVLVEGQDPAVVAASLGLTPGAVYTTRSRVLRRLREALGDEASGQDTLPKGAPTAGSFPDGPAPCPSRTDLRDFLKGKLPSPILDRVAGHLERCQSCASALDLSAAATDPMITALRQVPPTQGQGEAAEAARAVRLVKALDGRMSASEPTPVPADTSPGATTNPGPVVLGQLGQYDLLEKLGEGGMGQVFKARHRLMERVVAVKVIHPGHVSSSAARSRFEREIRALARLDHPNIVRAQYADQENGRHFLVMEHVPGINLAEVVRQRGPLPVAEACACAEQVAQALQYAHDHGLVHRDIKPSNLLLTAGGQIKVLDLGLVLLRDERPAGDRLTGSGQVLGTCDYMAPEQWESTHAVDIRADLYSLGCTLFYLLTGQPPFSGPEYATLARKRYGHATAPAPSLRERRPDVPPGLSAVVGRLLAKEPSGRYGAPAELCAALQPFLAAGPGLSAGPTPAAAPAGSLDAPRPAIPVTRVRRRRRLVGLLLAGGALGLAALLAAWRLSPTPATGSVQGTGQSARESPAPAIVPAGSADRGTRAGLPPAPVQIVSFEAGLFRGDNPPVFLGDLGDKAFQAREEDTVRVRADLGEPAYFYLIALNADGQDQLCCPAEESTAPAKASALSYPRDRLKYFALTDGPGLQAFVLVASRRPLPSYREWKAGAPPLPWKRLPPERAWGVWEYDRGRVVLRNGPERGTERVGGLLAPAVALAGQPPQAGLAGLPWWAYYASSLDGPVQRLEAASRFLAGRPGVDTVRALAFPVQPQK